MPKRRPYVGGNWKMNLNRASVAELARGVADAMAATDAAECAVFPPFPYLLLVGAILRDRGSNVRLGAQDVYHKPDGAYTGEISIDMLRDCGVTSVLVGHSERRHVIGETDPLVNLKTRAVLDAGMQCVLCVGETLDERLAGHTEAVNQRQVRAALADVPGDLIRHLVIAYEPVWAIGTGKNATPEDAQEVHQRIRQLVSTLYGAEIASGLRIIYGGSLKPSNALEICTRPDVDGGLVGGASLKTADFVGIVRAAAGLNSAPA